MKTLALLLLSLYSTASYACPGPNVCAGDRIIDSDDNVGTAEAVFSNGKAKVTLDGYSGSHVRELQDLGKGVACVRHVCARDRIIDSDENAGSVEEVFTNGKAKVTLDGYSGMHIRNVADLKKGRRCVRDICVGSRIIDADDNVGRVEELFGSPRDPQAKVTLDGYSGMHIRNVRDLGRGWRCIGPACKGDAIMDADDNTGRILALFSNGKVQVSLDGYSGLHIRNYNDLGLKLSCRPGLPCDSCRD